MAPLYLLGIIFLSFLRGDLGLATFSPTTSGSRTTSVSRCLSATRTVSKTNLPTTRLATRSGSVTVSFTRSVSRTVTKTALPTTRLATLSVSVTVTRCLSASRTGSRSELPTTRPATRSASPSYTRSVTLSPSSLTSPSRSSTTTVSVSYSRSPSTYATPTATLSSLVVGLSGGLDTTSPWAVKYSSVRHTGLGAAGSVALLPLVTSTALTPYLLWSTTPTTPCIPTPDMSPSITTRGLVTSLPPIVVWCGVGMALTNGSILYSLGASATSSTPALDASGGLAVVGSTSGVQGFNPVTGMPLWNYPGPPSISSPVEAPGGLFFLGNSAGFVLSLTASGTLRWSRRLSTVHPISSSPALGPDGSVFVALDALYSLRGQDGAVRWATLPFPAVSTLSSPLVSLDASLVLTLTPSRTLNDTFLTAYSYGDGGMAWSTPIGLPTNSTPTQNSVGVVVVSTGSHVFGFNATTGVLVWANALGGLGGGTHSTPAHSLDGVSVMGTSKGGLVGLNTSGALVFNFSGGGSLPVAASPVIGGNGTVTWSDTGGGCIRWGSGASLGVTLGEGGLEIVSCVPLGLRVM